MTTVSALTIAAGRPAHLRNVVAGFQAQQHKPCELIIGVMQDHDYDDLPATDFPIRQIRVTAPELPLSAARNAVADAACGQVLVFVDVDCIPAPDFIAGYLARMEGRRGLFMGEVLYLPQGATDQGLDFDRLAGLAVKHSDRQGPPAQGIAPCGDYRCFWSLNFALWRADWLAGPRFDEDFTGYGGEDTDFGRAWSEAGLPIWWIAGGRVYHQYHPHCMPPVHHLHSVLRNTEVFARKWGHRTMEHWLHAFRLMGLIRNTADGLQVLREPGPAEFALCEQQGHMPYANSRRVIDQLQQAPDRLSADRATRVAHDQQDMLLPAAE
ncbi:glycosyltransferase [Paracoccus hibiscisoli]|uniref:Glycosyltransferase n=1 Tax=Paracoccus hibiscisoli TaxID=2023261 RepID=A0A4U0QR10_9RHOB|nr:glycosyltransferase [Paracoccus hibiscisoli]TJZ84421.1 glycosyltransferase [Paracoccus hibiscisoli]